MQESSLNPTVNNQQVLAIESADCTIYSVHMCCVPTALRAPKPFMRTLHHTLHHNGNGLRMCA